jgi:hypothetical protein
VLILIQCLSKETREHAEERACFEALRQLEAKAGRRLTARWVGRSPKR